METMGDIPREIILFPCYDNEENKRHGQQLAGHLESTGNGATDSSHFLKRTHGVGPSPLPWRGWSNNSSGALKDGKRLKEVNQTCRSTQIKPPFLRSVSLKLFSRRYHNKLSIQNSTTCTCSVAKNKNISTLHGTKRTLETCKSVDDTVADINDRLDSLDLLLQNYLDEIGRGDADEDGKKEIRSLYAKQI
eukprot:CAMPEP_0178647190 /NCGR_PEP_ID=MMETSP0698-20121128/19786_1 /TAXON_ID=265572 /ORGANISM="Extubocellulus spinifer, Strain CCMP396" /LENGTH=190 /DNA_ID=CAMNT_0020288417 /DNA_START=292 /DNA_END=861 /DNA_ORIENTATION=+